MAPDAYSSLARGTLLADRIGRIPGVAALRTAYGKSTSVWAAHDHEVADTWWIALSGTVSPDYNSALLHGPDAPDRVDDVLRRIKETGRPATVALAGAGLAAAGRLQDEGWVLAAALPFMYGEPRPGAADERVRLLQEDDLAAATAVLARTFHVPEQSAAACYHPGLSGEDGILAWGLFDPELVSCGIDVQVGDHLYVGWALATDPAHQGRGYGARLVGHVDHWYYHHGRRSSLHVGSTAGARLYAARQHPVVEHWQHWSRPRWLLGA